MIWWWETLLQHNDISSVFVTMKPIKSRVLGKLEKKNIENYFLIEVSYSFIVV